MLLASASAAAYCRESTCDTAGARCEPAEPDDCGTALHWDRTCIGFAVQKDGSNVVTASEARGLLRRAFGAWESADCGAGSPGVRVADMGYVDCARTEYNDHAGNANVLVFRDHDWPHPEGTDNVALTTITYDLASGRIYDADIEVNTAQYDITTRSDAPDYDLLAVLTHEAGHFLGLAHSPDEMATMYAVYKAGDLGLRTLGDDDVSGICALFPPAAQPIPDTCDPIPRHGFAAQCGSEQDHATCSVSPGPRGEDGAPALVLSSIAALAMLVRRRRRG